jgi:uncharacterized membrane protein YphA (DoxX/SURF4 family)
VSAALTPALFVAAAVLCLAGVLKLRQPAAAERAVSALGLPSDPLLVRSLAAVELSVGVLAIVAGGRSAAAGVACMYLLFAAVAALLARRDVSCGCFGEDRTPASAFQAGLSGAFAVVAVLAALSGTHGLGWALAQGPALPIGIAGAVYATVLAYTELPAAWIAWSGSAR